MGLFAFNAMRRKAEAEALKKAELMQAAKKPVTVEEPAPVETAVKTLEAETAVVEKKKRKKAATVEKKEE